VLGLDDGLGLNDGVLVLGSDVLGSYDGVLALGSLRAWI